VFIFKIDEQKRTEKIGTNKPQKKEKKKDEIKETINTMKFLVFFNYTHKHTLKRKKRKIFVFSSSSSIDTTQLQVYNIRSQREQEKN